MDLNFVLLLCIALIFVVDTTKGNGDHHQEQVVSNLTDTTSRFVGGSADNNVTADSKSIIIHHSNNSTSDDDTQTHLGDGSKMINGGDTTTTSAKSEQGKVASDGSETTKEEPLSNSSRKKQGFHGEDCDPSNMCTDQEHEFVACLRVPGNDAPDLSLLIQNKGKRALLVTIAAPGFVRLEKNSVQLLQNEDTKVKVSIKKGGANDSAIVLTSSKGHCSLELKDLAVAHETESEDTVSVSRPSVLNIRPRTLIVIIMISFLVLTLVVIPVIIHVCKKNSGGNNKYQRLDMELPVSNPAVVTKSDKESGEDGWNNNWGDDWDDENGDGDEEQPNTPVLPLTPSVSSRGLAPRRLSKEGWKD
ncbi:PREDICTED: uncharacterized protein LOC104753109 isoform X1 [Camelina sativa]|uniref:Uncharacterized protein LOC104753109 isoform X1 n=1 Tax=Camelina sativa TaxID=90675 RepID=A0ABM1R573_CAMSA|nr:PREDICTED: uncharacterized protein LOC104753109 isoform X1 [Camelina sativa]XP_010473703.1 PREDICTED: uncharacterized protein LOC104753109 isoform X1 [Camelina sativa]XP_019094161.1 PREDICTED: uncharacterized protein LOC104753109 isoform X2 [Camelina sativa]XP_019094162.1 PREDICTED: uncharacterized protein LOC104753109 isoform X1 [Camelina sativa]